MPGLYSLEKIADFVHREFDIKSSSVQFIRHSGAMTFQIQDDHSNAFHFRIYCPISEFISRWWTSMNLVKSEMLWLNYLNSGSDLLVPKPIKTKKGQWTVLFEDDHGKGIPCALFHWLEGEVCANRTLNKKQAEQAGLFLAQVHLLGKKWIVPDEFERPQYDIHYLQQALREAEKHVENEVLSRPEFGLFIQSVEKIGSVMQNLGHSEEHWGLIHGDYSPYNFIYQRGGMGLLDFSEFGFGHYLLDIGHCFLRIGPEKGLFWMLMKV